MRAAALLVLAACGSTTGGSSIDANNTTVTSIAITPDNVMIKRGLAGDQQLTAMATLSTGATVDVTDRATWTSSGPSIASVDRGTVKALTSGMVTITASYGGKDGTSSFKIASPEMFVSDYAGNHAIDVFDAYTSGDAAPLRRIVGATTTFVDPIGIAVYKDEIYVTDIAANAIDVFPLGATGDVAPTRRIVGGSTTLANPLGLVVYNDEIYVTSSDRVAVFPTSATGNVAPTRAITGATTQLAGINYGIAIDNGELYVGNFGGIIAVFPVTATGDVAPTRFIQGAATQIAQIYGLWVANHEIFVASGDSALVFVASANGNVAPIRRIIGPDTAITPTGVIALGQELYVTNVQGNVQVFSRQSTSDTPPVRTTTGAMTTLLSAFSTAFY